MIRTSFQKRVIIHRCVVPMATYFKIMKKDGKASCSIWIEKTYPIVCDLYVSEESRRKGVATKMLKLCEEIVKQEGYSEVFLWTAEGSWLVDWYKRQGYTPTGEILLRPGESFRNIWLRKEL